MKILLKGGILITGEKRFQADVLIEDHVIANIADRIDVQANQEINCEGKYILPGMIDTHVHFREPGLTHKAEITTESMAAISGGVTTVFDMPNTKPPATTLEIVKQKQELYRNKSLCNFGITIGAAKDNINELKSADEDPTIPAIKIFMAGSTGNMTLYEDEFLEPIFRDTKKMIIVHAEDEKRCLSRAKKFKEGTLPESSELSKDDPYQHSIIRDNLTAGFGTKKVVELALKYKHRTHILHISAAVELPFLKEGVEAKIVSGETCPHYLFFEKEDIKKHHYLIMNPSLKGKIDQEALWEAVNSGLISQITTDHAPHLLEEKMQPYGKCPVGLPGVEFVLPLMLNSVKEGKLRLEQLVRLVSKNPAQNFGIQNKGFLKQGYDADIVIVNPDKDLKISNGIVRSKCAWTPYAGMTLKGGKVEKTFVNGNLVFDNGAVVSEEKGKSIQIQDPKF